MREYEVTVILKPDLDEEARNQLIERVQDWLAPGAADEDKAAVSHWGQRSLAYPIRKFTEGYYVFYEARLDPLRINEIERNIIYAEDILRHLVVRKDD